MLFEHRTYTLKAGCVDDFWQAQRVRGYDLVRPILERQVGYFETLGGGADQVIHLYRYDSFDAWRNRLHGLYGVAALEPYFHKVRSMMLAQENKLIIPAQGSKFQRAQLPLPTLVEQHTTVLLPGSMSLYWQAWREHGSKVLAADGAQLIGCLTSLVGIQHHVVL